MLIPYGYRRGTGSGSAGRSPLPFFENWKKCPNFEKKFHDCGDL